MSSHSCVNENCCATTDAITIIENPALTSQVIQTGTYQYTHIAGDGAVTVINVDPNISIVQNGNGSATLHWGTGSLAVLDICSEVAAGCSPAVVTAIGPLVTTNGVSVAIGETYVEFPNGETWAYEKSNPFNIPAYADAVAAAGALPSSVSGQVYVFWDLSDNTIKANP